MNGRGKGTRENFSSREFGKLEPNRKAVSALNPNCWGHIITERPNGTSETLPRDRTDRRGRPDAAGNDLSAAGGERRRRHRVRKRGGRRTGAGERRWQCGTDADRRATRRPHERR